ncbi:MAG: hypothetical protein Q8L64_03080 [bacterium]|jgi:hypothetical protein|nr:hypothetical protein [bacterium]
MKLLATKLQPPVLPKHFLSRPRLLGILSEARNHKLSLLSAPTGYGKTSLVREWVSNLSHSPASATPNGNESLLKKFCANSTSSPTQTISTLQATGNLPLTKAKFST